MSNKDNDETSTLGISKNPKHESYFCHTLIVKDWPLFPANFQSWSLAAAVVVVGLITRG